MAVVSVISEPSSDPTLLLMTSSDPIASEIGDGLSALSDARAIELSDAGAIELSDAGAIELSVTLDAGASEDTADSIGAGLGADPISNYTFFKFK